MAEHKPRFMPFSLPKIHNTPQYQLPPNTTVSVSPAQAAANSSQINYSSRRSQKRVALSWRAVIATSGKRWCHLSSQFWSCPVLPLRSSRWLQGSPCLCFNSHNISVRPNRLRSPGMICGTIGIWTWVSQIRAALWHLRAPHHNNINIENDLRCTCNCVNVFFLRWNWIHFYGP